MAATATPTSPCKAPQQNSSWVSLLFFMMGAMNIYVFLRNQGNWFTSQATKLLRLLFISVVCAAAIEYVVLQRMI